MITSNCKMIPIMFLGKKHFVIVFGKMLFMLLIISFASTLSYFSGVAIIVLVLSMTFFLLFCITYLISFRIRVFFASSVPEDLLLFELEDLKRQLMAMHQLSEHEVEWFTKRARVTNYGDGRKGIAALPVSVRGISCCFICDFNLIDRTEGSYWKPAFRIFYGDPKDALDSPEKGSAA